MVRPVSSKIPVTLGYRQKMRSRPSYIHRGVDFGCPVGTPVHASRGGKVVHAGTGGMGSAFGIHVVVKTADGIYVIVAHLSSKSVSKGQTVATGELLGKSGATGNVTGPHTHYGEFTAYHYEADRKPRYLDDVLKPIIEIAAKEKWVVNTDVLNVRNAPVTGKVVATKKRGFTFTSSAFAEVDGVKWVKHSSGKWYSSKYLKPVRASIPAAPAPAPVAPSPAPAAPSIEEWLTVATINLAGYNDYGFASWGDRRKAFVADVKQTRPDILAVQELHRTWVSWTDTQLAKLGYKRVAKGSDGRYLYIAKDIKVLEAANFDLQPRYINDDRQASAAILERDGVKFFAASFHLEHRNGSAADKVRVGQAKSLHKQADALRKKHGVATRDSVYLGDGNSESMVLKQGLKPEGFVDAATLASSKVGTAYRSFVGWAKKVVKGARIDVIAVYKDLPVLSFSVHTSKEDLYSDHLMSVAVLGRKSK